MELEVGIVRAGEREHDSLWDIGVSQTYAVSYLVSQSLQEVSAVVLLHSPVLRVVNVNVTSLRVVGMS